MTNTVDWSSFGGFKGVKKKDMESAFSDSVGGAFFDTGTHKDVYIDSVEPMVSKKGNHMLKIAFKNDAGASINKFLIPMDKKQEFSLDYRKLARAIVSDHELRVNVFSELFIDNPQTLDALRGLKLTINVGLGSDGWIVKKSAIGDGYLLCDVETDAPYEDVADVVFDSYTEVKEKAEELGIRRCYNEVKSLLRGSKDAVTANEEALREVLRSSGAQTGGVSAARSAASRPAI
jgi:hypothetical protein